MSRISIYMKSVIYLIPLCMLLRSCSCATVSESSVAVAKEEELVPLELPAGYEDRIRLLLPQLLNKLGIPSSLVPVNELLSSSVSTISKGYGYFSSWSSSEQDAACKAKPVDDGLKVTRYGMLMCKKQCSDRTTERVNFIRSTLESMYANDNRIEADIEVESKKKAFECAYTGQRYECMCLKNEIIKVSPNLKSLIYQLLQGGDKRRDLIPDHSAGKILTLILLAVAEKSIEAAAAPVLVPLKMVYHLYQFLKWVT